ncbi:MAG: CAP domain-containing protein, partial [Planctomycetota bacterium]|nr:CAP domain-containing protein [Planctomycetota bacterium]
LRRGELELAEEALARGEGFAVEELLEQVRLAKFERAEFSAKLEAALALTSPLEAKNALKSLVGSAPNPISKEELALARSSVADRAASDVASKPRRVVDDFEYQPGEPQLIVDHENAFVDAGAQLEPARLKLVFESVEAARGKRCWEQALTELEMVLPRAGSRSLEVRAIALEIEREAKLELALVLEESHRIEGANGVSSARSYLLKQMGRFPAAGSLSGASDELTRLSRAIGRRNQLDRGDFKVVVREPQDQPGLAGGARELALKHEAAGELRAAMDAWIDAGFAVNPGDERDDLIARGRALERRLLYRKEVVDAWELNQSSFAELDFTSIGEGGLERAGAEIPWASLNGGELEELGDLARLSERAKGGLLLSRLATGTDEDALRDLGRWVERGQMRSAEASALVATSLGEELPEGGYIYEDGRWWPRAEYEQERLAANLNRLKRELLIAAGEDREAVLSQLLDLGSVAEPVIEEILLMRWEAGSRKLQLGETLDSFRRLADTRRALDRTRAKALEAIFDEVEYFYPYNPPEPSTGKTIGDYNKAQREVDQLVSAVREAWEDKQSVSLQSRFRSGMEDILWVKEVARDELELELTLGSEVPDWIWGVDLELDQITLASFAWNSDEAYDLAMDREVRAYNEHQWETFRQKGKVLDGVGAAANQAEADQVRITNDYRVMMGRHALAWDPQVQAAADMHSDYMADTGDFGHFERGNPKRRTPGDRMSLCGYPSGAGENCYMGSASPRSAHDGWLHSSGHHRNILAPGHREMASGVVGNYWTQNFGRGTGYLNELRTWRD